jgi:hypothetical protein
MISEQLLVKVDQVEQSQSPDQGAWPLVTMEVNYGARKVRSFKLLNLWA